MHVCCETPHANIKSQLFYLSKVLVAELYSHHPMFVWCEKIYHSVTPWENIIFQNCCFHETVVDCDEIKTPKKNYVYIIGEEKSLSPSGI
jgi:hypothetical protein